MTEAQLKNFVIESNRIEGIDRPPTPAEIAAIQRILDRPSLEISDLETFVQVVAPGAKLRIQPFMNVRVGKHTPPQGGPKVFAELQALLARANEGYAHPFRIHCEYETLHPFMDGNGRSGRAVWLWQMIRQGIPGTQLGFLHLFYYQALDHSRA